jgi:hypothetical protein
MVSIRRRKTEHGSQNRSLLDRLNRARGLRLPFHLSGPRSGLGNHLEHYRLDQPLPGIRNDHPRSRKEGTMATTVLVTYATKYGSTREVAEAIAATLCEDGLQESFLPRGVSPIRQLGSTPCPESRSGENGSWAGGVPIKIPLRESGSRSCPGWLPIPNGAAATSSGSAAAAPRTLSAITNPHAPARHAENTSLSAGNLGGRAAS